VEATSESRRGYEQRPLRVAPEPDDIPTTMLLIDSDPTVVIPRRKLGPEGS